MIITDYERKRLLNFMRDLLEAYEYDYDDDVLETIIDEWVESKKDFITAFKKHPCYVDGQFMIAFSKDYERSVDIDVLTGFSKYIKTRVAQDCEDNLPNDVKTAYNANYYPYMPAGLYHIFDELDSTFAHQKVTDDMKMMIDNALPSVRVHIGEKTSRVINKICKYLGYDKHPSYNQEFARYADSLNPIKIKRHTVISVNPLDYLTMSFGNSWSSCHTIDKENLRGMPNNYHGCFSSGTMSYMLDKTSFVFYTVSASYDGNEFWNEPKINRQMFHYGNDKLIQGRVYPQGTDESGGIYTQYRNVVQEQLALVFNFTNLWKLQKGTDAIKMNTESLGTHYRDYLQFSSCTLSTLAESDNTDRVVIGEKPICIKCGIRHNVEDNLNHCKGAIICNHCGCEIEDEDDINWIGGLPYCDDCVVCCDICGSLIVRDDSNYIEREERHVCSVCYNKYYVVCENCHELVYRDDIHYLVDGSCVCESCYEDCYVCDGCHHAYFKDDLHYVEETGEYLCDNCFDEYSTEDVA